MTEQDYVKKNETFICKDRTPEIHHYLTMEDYIHNPCKSNLLCSWDTGRPITEK